jgi:hypothetical protein
MTIEHRLEKLETMIAEIHAVVTGESASQTDGVDTFAYGRAIKALARGNTKPLERYMKRGGKIPRVK